ncbi:MAG: S8 family serine peptidase [Melioribacteraceae bacterium]|nr:S8 family serine peptidase [Melioribacteraceae bacterium]
MKKYFLLFCIILFTNIYSQDDCPTCPPNKNVTDTKEYDVIKLDSRASQSEFIPNQVLVKFKDESVVHLSKTSAGKTVLGISKVDEILSKYNLQEAKKLFAGEKRKLILPKVKTYSGNIITVPNLHNIYKLEFDSTQNILQIINELKEDTDNIDYAEPNYIYSAVESEALSPELSESEMIEWLKNHPNIKTNFNSAPKDATDAVTPNDPLYSQQWGIPATEIDQVWSKTTGDTSQVIAILDTGVDWLHPDLINKIWSNPNEIPDNGYDDDHNGFVDDVRGWDWINWDNNPTDDNSHGTHVAGIAAAEANNGIGIAGANWGAKIMPLKVFQSSGRGDASTITQAIIYASNKGATVINMSFGSYSRSATMEAALANAYSTTLLVAAAGNDSRCIGPGTGCAPFFPAAFSFVLGIEANAGFSNYDQDGPTFSLYNDLLNYELTAPGSEIISTIPKGGYRVYNGTSMSAPLASGGLALYRKLIPIDEETPEFMWVKLIQSTTGIIKLNKALDFIPKPEVWFLNNTMVDTLDNDDRDGNVDAGETIQLWFSARNTGGQVDSVYWKIKLAEFEDPTTVEIIKPTSYIGSISPYATRTSEKDPMKFKISPNVAHGRDITFVLSYWYKGCEDTLSRNFVFTAENGEELFGVLDSTKTLYADRLYLVNKSFKVGVDGTLIIKPGTKILFYPDKTVPISGRLIAEGKPDSLISFVGYSPWGGGAGTIFTFRNDYSIKNRFSYCSFENLNWPLGSASYVNPASVFNSIFTSSQGYASGYAIGFVDSVVNNLVIASGEIFYSFRMAKFNNFIGPSTSSSYYINNYLNSAIYSLSNNLFYNNFINYRMPPYTYDIDLSGNYNSWISEYYKYYREWNGTFYKDTKIYLTKFYTYYNSSADFQRIQYQYWGTSDSLKIENFITDFMENPTTPRAIFSPYLSAPPDSCHGVVWKVLVNGKDAQDEKVDPVGIGKQKFDVYFNREMNKNFIPEVGFGVRYPFSSNSVNEDGHWSEDGKIWTVYKTVKLYSGDGINRIRVSQAKDLEGWEIPLEDMRFEFLIDAAGSASTEFTASAGIGKVDLEWTTPSDLETLLGYNLYRFNHIDDTTLTAPQQINTSLITDTLYTDFSVQPLSKYYYQYKVVKTDFTESDFSKVVNTTVLTATAGDANGDLAVNILDITTVVNYILSQNPQPFILAAADFNDDGQVNILDIVAIINKVLNPNGGAKMLAGDTPKFRFTDTGVYLKKGIGIAGIELKIALNGAAEGDLIAGDLLKGMEFSYKIENDTLKVIAYSFKNETISSEDGLLFKLLKGKIIKLVDLKAADRFGNQVEVEYSNDDIVLPTDFILYQNYPNPFNPETTIRFALPEKANVEIAIYNILGQRVKLFNKENSPAGYHVIKWNSRNDHNVQLASGVYIYQIKAGNYVNQKKMILLK